MRFNLAMGRSLSFGSTPCNLVALFRLAFATAPCRKALNLATYSNSPVHYAKGTRSDRSRPQGSASILPLFVSIWFQVLFHSPSGVLFTFPSRYLFTIGRQLVFSLGRWSSQIPTGFLVSRGTWVPDKKVLSPFAYRTCTFYG